MSANESQKPEAFKKEDMAKILKNSLYTLWVFTALVVIWRLASSQLEMNSGENLFIYVYKTSSFVAFSFFSTVILLDFLLRSFTVISEVPCKIASICSVLLLSFTLSFFVSYDDLVYEMSMAHISANEYRRCDDGHKYRYKGSFHWILVARQLSECSRINMSEDSLLIGESRYKRYEKAIGRLKEPPAVQERKRSKIQTSVTKEVTKLPPKVGPTPTVIPTPEATPEQVTPLPTFKVTHRLLYYGEGEVMISNFKHLPSSVLREIEKVRKKGLTEEFKKVDLTKYIPEILSVYAMPKYKGISYKGEVDFKFSKATLIHSLSKGDCFNYPDTYISLVSKDFKATINGKEYIGYPESEFTVFPESTKKVKDKKAIKELNKKMSHVYNPQNPLVDHPLYFSISDKVYALVSEVGMETSYTIFECTEKCLKADYYLWYPECGS